MSGKNFLAGLWVSKCSEFSALSNGARFLLGVAKGVAIFGAGRRLLAGGRLAAWKWLLDWSLFDWSRLWREPPTRSSRLLAWSRHPFRRRLLAGRRLLVGRRLLAGRRPWATSAEQHVLLGAGCHLLHVASEGGFNRLVSQPIEVVCGFWNYH